MSTFRGFGRIAFLAVLSLWMGLGLGGAKGARWEPVEIKKEGFSSAGVCGQCHEEIFQTWKNSMHSVAFSDPIFQTAYGQAVAAEGESGRKLCLGCHAPAAVGAGTVSFGDPMLQEGVTCDWCHTVTGVTPDGSGHSFTNEPGVVKRSILKQAVSPVHEVAYSPVHGTSEFCAGCHEFQGQNGVLILGTYSEWKSGPYAAEGVQCQQCHMPQGAGPVVREGISESAPIRMNLHDISGAHSEEMLRKALKLEVVKVVSESGYLQVTVAVQNQGAGHSVPTGMPSRKIQLEVTVVGPGGQVLASEQRVYGRVLRASDGRQLKSDYELMLYSGQVDSDNRLRPRERREETFRFQVAKGHDMSIEASLSYLYRPELIQPSEMRVDFVTMSRETP